MWPKLVVIGVLGYLLGNFNGAILISRLFSHEDVRKRGSGNAGLTNFVRNFGSAHAVAVIVIDVGKTVLACGLGRLLAPAEYVSEGIMLGAVAVSLGHDFPAFLGFKGGKGILCGAAVALCLDWRCSLILFAVFFVCLTITRYVSLSSIFAAIAFGVSFCLLYQGQVLMQLGAAAIASLAVFMHRENIGRLINGTERKFTFGKKENTQ